MPPRLHGLTILRFFAAFWVVWFHLQSRHPLPVAPRLQELMGNGAHAMALFFILSGMVLTYGYHDLQPGRSTWRFYLARLARIYPTYAAVHLLALFWFTPAQAGWLPWAYANTVSTLGLQAWVFHVLSLGINGGTWTISAEFFFYALFPLLLPLVMVLRRTAGTGAVCIGLVALSSLIGLADYVFAQDGTFVYYVMPLARLPEFALGIGLGLMLLEPARSRFSPGLNLLAATGVTLFAVAHTGINFGGLWIRGNLVVLPLFGWLLYSAARAEQHYRPNWRYLPARLLIYLGESSYALFLGHLLLLLAIESPAGKIWVSRLKQNGAILEFAIVFAFCAVALAILLHELVEKPARRLILRRWGDGPGRRPVPDQSATLMPLRR